MLDLYDRQALHAGGPPLSSFGCAAFDPPLAPRPFAGAPEGRAVLVATRRGAARPGGAR